MFKHLPSSILGNPSCSALQEVRHFRIFRGSRPWSRMIDRRVLIRIPCDTNLLTSPQIWEFVWEFVFTMPLLPLWYCIICKIIFWNIVCIQRKQQYPESSQNILFTDQIMFVGHISHSGALLLVVFYPSQLLIQSWKILKLLFKSTWFKLSNLSWVKSIIGTRVWHFAISVTVNVCWFLVVTFIYNVGTCISYEWQYFNFVFISLLLFVPQSMKF